MQKTDPEKWEEIGEEVKQAHEGIVDLMETLESVPKTEWREEYEKAEEGMSQLKNALDGRFCKEHPEDFDVDVFYGKLEDE